MVAIFAYDLVIGRALELALSARALHVQLSKALTEPQPALAELSGADAVLLGPRVSAKFRRELLSVLEGTLEMAGIPVLQLTNSLHYGSSSGTQDDDEDGRVTLVAWPCRVEELQLLLEAKMSHERTGSSVSEKMPLPGDS